MQQEALSTEFRQAMGQRTHNEEGAFKFARKHYQDCSVCRAEIHYELARRYIHGLGTKKKLRDGKKVYRHRYAHCRGARTRTGLYN